MANKIALGIETDDPKNYQGKLNNREKKVAEAVREDNNIEITGKGKLAKVNDKQRLDVSASVFTEAHLVSAQDGQAYTWTSSFSGATGNEVIYIKNDSKTKKLLISHIRVSCVTTGLFELFEVTGTAGGTVITGKNLNLSSSNVPDATTYGDASVTGLTIGDRIALTRCAATDTNDLAIDDALILGFNNAIAITWTGGSTTIDCEIIGYFEKEGDL